MVVAGVVGGTAAVNCAGCHLFGGWWLLQFCNLLSRWHPLAASLLAQENIWTILIASDCALGPLRHHLCPSRNSNSSRPKNTHLAVPSHQQQSTSVVLMVWLQTM